MSAASWKTLSAIDCTKHVEKKGNLSYLSWAWAWGILMEYYPDSTFVFSDDRHHSDGTVTVECSVTVDGTERSMWLPVMDHKNKSIVNPTSRDISDARMRCLVKCIGLHGLGLYIYAGEDLPQAVQDAVITDEQFREINDALDETQSDKVKFLEQLNIESLKEMKASDYKKAKSMIDAKKARIKAIEQARQDSIAIQK